MTTARRAPASLSSRGTWWKPWRAVFVGFALAFLTGMAAAAIARSFGQWNRGFEWERALLVRLHTPLPGAADELVLGLTWFGTNISLIPAVAILCGWLWVKCKRPDAAAQLAVVQIGSYLLNPSLKMLTDRQRPTMFVRRGWYAWSSFPSGHAIAGVSVLVTVMILLYRVRGWRWPAYVLAPIALASLYSRLYLGVHWPTDVLAGLAVGTVWLAVTMYAFRDRRSALGQERRQASGVDVAAADDGGDAVSIS
ncbi:MAG: phosphatase PAP2 family protein [Gemmatimonadaceae bacterium]